MFHSLIFQCIWVQLIVLNNKPLINAIMCEEPKWISILRCLLKTIQFPLLHKRDRGIFFRIVPLSQSIMTTMEMFETRLPMLN